MALYPVRLAGMAYRRPKASILQLVNPEKNSLRNTVASPATAIRFAEIHQASNLRHFYEFPPVQAI
ncbi:Hypothetical protein CpMEX30_1569 [Corynebacterium pseudotuberculosis]|uniref:Uncharacterized protein n=2 Tax=Corynebacterium pseudotuberculosis TaxID=1719 RepID=D9QBQ7_CORP2|nr:hypothetical protein CPC231_07655 [Corynebacterium pseudotuberculosis C231]ADL21384.1 hypothetical protein CP1002_05490 [Corynebacterium pseudotuberculosis 1002]ADO26783.1 hypothetical protein CPI19_03865 [Corynebacterium pseudotuberculosis I19]AEK92848.1 Hypothetical protein CpPAT10_1517 [Corynebacterium pseudotuberculosis PAT10]AEP70752.1 Hypothetical protein Cp4202_1507 [Corynebacterium pseudotuberculosis 42/02-A]AEQ07054.1 hypothetical protein CPCIP5297_07770 [Corynebacterium pseudotube